jgi:hypothetical protein
MNVTNFMMALILLGGGLSLLVSAIINQSVKDRLTIGNAALFVALLLLLFGV